MKYRLTDDQYTLFTQFIASMSYQPNVNRSLRRNIFRLANKFAPPRSYVDLKPADKINVIGLAKAGLASMANAEVPEDRKEHFAKLKSTIEQVLEKLDTQHGVSQ